MSADKIRRSIVVCLERCI